MSLSGSITPTARLPFPPRRISAFRHGTQQEQHRQRPARDSNDDFVFDEVDRDQLYVVLAEVDAQRAQRFRGGVCCLFVLLNDFYIVTDVEDGDIGTLSRGQVAGAGARLLHQRGNMAITYRSTCRVRHHSASQSEPDAALT